MADFNPSFGSVGGNTRLPTVDERQNGFPCGPADQQLFNGMFRRLEEEMQAVFDGAGVAGLDGDNTILYQSILALIAAATGGSGDYVLMSQARARLPFFPDVQTTDGTLGVISPGTGQIRIPAGKVFQHRGIFQVTTALTDIATAANKTYHLRWNPTDGFALKDLADVAYNSTSALETSAIFDSTYDDMLVARVTTNSSNVPTITNLANFIKLSMQYANRYSLSGALDWTVRAATGLTLNWARTPTRADIAIREFRIWSSGPSGVVTDTTKGVARNMGVRLASFTRYAIADWEFYFEDSAAGTANQDGAVGITINAEAA